MAERVLQYAATIPAGTLITAPATITLPLDNFEIERIDLEVPPGPSGAMGFALVNNGQPWIPRNAGEWFVWDDQRESFEVTGYPTASGWAVTGYNSGNYPHTVTARFHVNPIPTPTLETFQPYVLTFVEHDVKPLPMVTL